MKKCFIYAVLMAMTMSTVSCGSSAKDEAAAAADSARIAQQAVAAAKAAEQARLDSIRQDSIMQDSIKKEQAQAFLAKLPAPRQLLSLGHVDVRNYLKSLGFSGSMKTVYDLGEEGGKGTFSLDAGDGRRCTVIYDSSVYPETIISVTVVGDKEALDAYFNKAKKLRASYYEGATEVTRGGNTVKIRSFGV